MVIIVNFLANSLPLNGQTTADIANRLDVLFTPANYVFSIWGLIYLLLAVWVIRGFNKENRVYRITHIPFLTSCLFNIAWIFLWHYEYFASSVVVITLLLLSLIVLYARIEREHFSLWDRLPFSIYLGWISVAVIANISYTLTYYGWNGFGISDVAWTVVLLVIATTLAIIFRFAHHDRFYPLVFVWALFGIAVQNWPNEPFVATTALIFSVFVLISALLKDNG
ncbi:hypothetical protein BLL40_12030 [Domibacillus mangrovi]|uniref:Tryptophan-rich sensory protein n=2 Tax=Domibacillus mangrovi TaxID=1714354 RepID=A0A1Q5P1N5_9BACI|nr:hypothetical protein BLL40_12030 [Domibacillus mangrovi]